MESDAHTELLANLSSGKFSLPKRSCIYKARTKLDWLTMLYSQRVFARATANGSQWWSQIAADASPQAGNEYFSIVEERCASNMHSVGRRLYNNSKYVYFSAKSLSNL